MITPARFVLASALALSVLASLSVAQPSGGPYGPVQLRYEIPADATHVYYVAPDGDAASAGTELAKPTTLPAAIERAVTGDAIILRGGTYRVGALKFNQGITLQPYADERPVLKGTLVATEWEALRDGIWRTQWPTLFPQKPADWWRRHREGMRTPLHKFNDDMVFVDGRPLQSAAWEGGLDADSYSIDYEHGHVFIAFDPAGHEIEITAFDGGLTRTIGPVHGRESDHRGPVIRGLTLTQYATIGLQVEAIEPEGPADPSTFGKDVVGTTLENVTITHCSRVAAFLRGDRTTVRNCLISDTSTEGLYLVSSSDCLLEKNIFRRNNVEKITGYYPSAVKIFNQTHRVVCRDNYVTEQPDSNGIWYDVGNCDGVFVNNWVEDCIEGFFFEISQRAICAGNVFIRCDAGIRVLNSCDVRIYNNTLIDAPAAFDRDTRSAVGDHFGWHPATGPDVDERDGHVFENNLLVATGDFTRELLRARQPAVLCDRLTEPQLTTLDHNVYVRLGAPENKPFIIWSPAATETCLVDFASLDELRARVPQFEAHGRNLTDYRGPLFQSLELKRFALLSDFPATRSDCMLPEDIRNLLGWPKDTPVFPGAVPPL